MKTRWPRAVVLVLLWIAPGVADDAALKASARAQVEEINEALIRGKFDRIADLTHPRVVELTGGREKMIALMESATREMKQKGYSVLSSKAGDPTDLVEQGTDLFVVVPFVLEMKAPGGKLSSPGFVVGVSGDRGKTWGFVNNPKDPESLKLILPGLPERLKIPERKEPTFRKD